MRRRFVRALILALFVAPLACSFIVDLSGLGGDGGPDSSVDAAQDAALDHAAEAEASLPDASLDAESDVACATPTVGNTIVVAASGLAQLFYTSGPLVTGDYIVTSGSYWCLGCKGTPGAVVGGVHITVNGANVSIERRVDFVAGTTVHRLDRWHGTFDQINRALSLTEDCPEAGATTSWFTEVAIASDGGPTGQIEFSFPDVMGADPDSGVPIDLALFLSKK